MPVLSAVAHLSADPTERLGSLAALARIPGLTLGDVHGVRLAFVLESDDRAQDKDRWAQVEAVPGLQHLELVFADFSDLTLSPPGEQTAEEPA